MTDHTRDLAFSDSTQHANRGLCLKVMTVVAVAVAGSAAWMILGGAQPTLPGFRDPQRAAEPLVFGQLPIYVSHRFEFRNDAGSNITIEKIETDCSCTVYESSVDPIEPGESGFFRLEMGMYQSGSKSTQALVTWSTGDQTIFVFDGQARATAELRSSIRRVDLRPGGSAEIDVSLTALSNEPPSLSVDRAGPGITVEPENWRLITEGRIEAGVSRRYEARPTVSASSEATGASYVIVEVPGAPPLIVTVHVGPGESPAG